MRSVTVSMIYKQAEVMHLAHVADCPLEVMFTALHDYQSSR